MDENTTFTEAVIGIAYELGVAKTLHKKRFATTIAWAALAYITGFCAGASKRK